MEKIVPITNGTPLDIPYQLVVTGIEGLHVVKEGTYYIHEINGKSFRLKDTNNRFNVSVLKSEIRKFGNFAFFI